MAASQLLCWVSAAAPLSLVDTANDREAVRLTDGAVGSATSLADAWGNLEAQTVTFALGSADSGTGSALPTALSTASASLLLSPAAATSKSAAMTQAP